MNKKSIDTFPDAIFFISEDHCNEFPDFLINKPDKVRNTEPFELERELEKIRKEYPTHKLEVTKITYDDKKVRYQVKVYPK